MEDFMAYILCHRAGGTNTAVEIGLRRQMYRYSCTYLGKYLYLRVPYIYNIAYTKIKELVIILWP